MNNPDLERWMALERVLNASSDSGSSEESDGGTSDIEIVEVQDNSPVIVSNENRLKALKCPICLETPEIVAVASCGHPYCHECIFTTLSSMRNATKVNGICSICRKSVRYDQVLYMEFKEESSKRKVNQQPTEGKRKVVIEV